MNQEHVSLTYEAITNPILRLLVYFLSAAVVALAGAVVYLYRDRQTFMRDLMRANEEAAKAYTLTAAALENINDQFKEVRHTITEHLLRKKP